MVKHFGIHFKLLGMSIFLSMLSVLVGAVGYESSQKVESEYEKVTEVMMPKMELVNDMFLDYRQIRISLRTLGLAGLSKQDAEAAYEDVLSNIKSYEEANAKYVALGFSEGQKAYYEVTEASWQEFKKVGARALALYKSGTPEDREKLLYIFLNDCPQKAKTYLESVEKLSAFHLAAIRETTKNAKEKTHDTNVFLVMIILGTVIFGFAIGVIISSSVAKELKAIANELIQNADEVSGTVSDLTFSSETLSSAATNQASAIQETAASIEEIRAMVERNSENAMESAEVSLLSKNVANDGKASVQDMISAMGDINASNQQIQTEIQNSNQRIQEIVRIIEEIESKTKVINEIVFQTKLLSFNASVEAARAGEHGKGFAVVAEEVGNLASMSGAAATEIGQLLTQSTEKVNSIVSETTTTVTKLIESSKAKVGRGSEVADACGKTLENIVANTDRLSKMVENISMASQEQASGVSEIAKAIQQLDEATQVNAGETKNTAASASRLGKQVKSLNMSSHRLQVLINGAKSNAKSFANTFVWKNQYALGVPEMDQEHKVLIEKINLLANAINQGAKRTDIAQYFHDLASYTKSHFDDEEAYMQSIQYPELSSHQKIHQALLAQVGQFATEVDKDHFDGAELISFLNDWLVKHIMGVDQKYAGHSQGKRKVSVLKKAA